MTIPSSICGVCMCGVFVCAIATAVGELSLTRHGAEFSLGNFGSVAAATLRPPPSP